MSRVPAYLFAALIAAAPVVASAQTPAAAPAPNGATEVNKRISNQQQNTGAAAANGQLTQQQATRANKTDTRVANQATRLEAKNGNGELTKGQTKHLNGELNRNAKISAAQQKRKTPAPNTTQ